MSESFDPRRKATARSTRRAPVYGSRARVAFLFANLLGSAGACTAEAAAEKDLRLQEVVIQAERQAADQQVTEQVQQALAADPWIFSEHVTVTTRNGIVVVEGIVQDTGELFRILRLARRIPGARRVYSQLEVLHNDPDGG
jgi:osmotically-inducible protein OsmY